MPSERPNILLITTDQQRTDTLGCYGAGWMRTPYLDALAAGGVRFDRAYTVSPLCTPSRVSLFTGQYPSRHGAWNVGCNAIDDGTFLSHALGAAGYRTHHIGKAHWQANLASAEESAEALRDNPRFPAWSGPYYGFATVELSIGHNGYNLLAGHHAAWVRAQSGGATDFPWTPLGTRPFGGEAVDWGIPLAWHASVWTADRARDFLDHHDPNTPFFLHLGFQDPHHPHAVPTEFSRRINPDAVPLPHGDSGGWDHLPGHYRAAHEGRLETHSLRGRYPMAGQGEGFDYRGISETDVRAGRAAYYSLCQFNDDQIGRVLARLEETGLAENTLIVFTSDHGELLGDNGLWLKGCFPYDELLRVPLLLRWPGVVPAGLTVSDPISLVDLAPTLLAAAGCDPTGRDGVNWLPTLTHPDVPPPRRHVFAEHIDDPEGLRFRTVVTADEKLTVWQDGSALHSSWDDRSPEPARPPHLTRLLAELPHPPRLLPRLAYS